MTDLASRTVRRRLRVAGVVQGVGFRPFVHRLATSLGLDGSVANDAHGVNIEIEGPTEQVGRFATLLRDEAPPLARIETVVAEPLPTRREAGFEIRPTPTTGLPAVSVPPDTAICDDCLGELRDRADRRYRHPFITCTNCGPRFTIITGLPYDRPATTMAGFAMCSRCRDEYDDPADRRHHAQPLACPDCGPTLVHHRAGEASAGTDAVLAAVHDDLTAGRVVAVKGLGGYHLAVDAADDPALARLRARKHRADKPFAVMVPNLDAARAIAVVGDHEAVALTSPARPVVLLEARPNAALSPLVAPASPLVGVMLPYTPLHHLLFEPVPGRTTTVPRVLVMTSGNMAGEPICHDDDDAGMRLAGLADSFCTHDRPIHIPCDDSVVRCVDGTETPIRRSRGHTPLPVHLPFSAPPVLAVGGELKNAFCLANDRRGFMSQHLGDMENLPSLEALERSADLLGRLYAITPSVVATDLHPDYHTRRWARDRAGALGVPLVGVQHHHAHLAALMTEHGLDAGEEVTGIVFDGTGWGDDDTLWGGEILVGGYRTVERQGHLAAVPLPGGDAAVRAPWRTALAHLRAAGSDTTALPEGAAPPDERRLVEQQLDRDVGCASTTSMGRLFDAVASLLGVRHHISYEAQAAIELEHLAAGAPGPAPGLEFDLGADLTFDAAPLVWQMAEQQRAGVDPGRLALAFHHAVADLCRRIAEAVRDQRGPTTVGLTGGVFQNDLLTRLATTALHDSGFTVLTHRLVPANDGGLALGQVAVAAHAPPEPRDC